MKCFGEYSDDRVCGLCSICNKEELYQCYNKCDMKPYQDDECYVTLKCEQYLEEHEDN